LRNQPRDTVRPVIVAGDCDDPTRLAQLIAMGANVNRRLSSSRNETPLGIAATRGNVEACRVLLTAGADPSIGSLQPISPLCLLIEERFMSGLRGDREMPVGTAIDVARLLVEFGCDPNGTHGAEAERNSWQLPLYTAALHQDHAMVAELVRLGAQIDRKVMHLSVDASCRRKEVLTTTLGILQDLVAKMPALSPMLVTLLRLGADDTPLANPGNNQSAFQLAVMVGHDVLVEYYIRERGEDLNQEFEGRPIEECAWKEETRLLLRALRAERNVVTEIDSTCSKDAIVAPRPTKAGGLAL
jgi:hypothetical protein